MTTQPNAELRDPPAWVLNYPKQGGVNHMLEFWLLWR